MIKISFKNKILIFALKHLKIVIINTQNSRKYKHNIHNNKN